MLILPSYTCHTHPDPIGYFVASRPEKSISRIHAILMGWKHKEIIRSNRNWNFDYCHHFCPSFHSSSSLIFSSFHLFSLGVMWWLELKSTFSGRLNACMLFWAMYIDITLSSRRRLPFISLQMWHESTKIPSPTRRLSRLSLCVCLVGGCLSVEWKPVDSREQITCEWEKSFKNVFVNITFISRLLCSLLLLLVGFDARHSKMSSATVVKQTTIFSGWCH